MIKCVDGVVEVHGKKGDLQQEFMYLAKALRDKNVFSDTDEMLDAVKFAISSSKEQKEMLHELIRTTLNSLFEEEDE